MLDELRKNNLKVDFALIRGICHKLYIMMAEYCRTMSWREQNFAITSQTEALV